MDFVTARDYRSDSGREATVKDQPGSLFQRANARDRWVFFT